MRHKRSNAGNKCCKIVMRCLLRMHPAGFLNRHSIAGDDMQKGSLIRSFFARFRSASTLSAPTPEDLARETAFRDFFIARCTHFRLLLAANKAALEGMAKLESMLSDAAQPDPLCARELCLEIAARWRTLSPI